MTKLSSLIDSLYPALPLSLQTGVCWAYGARVAHARFGRPFQRRLETLLESEWWEPGAIAAYQDEQVRVLVNKAHASVPFYRDIMQAKSLTPRDFHSVSDLQKLPILTKETVRRRARELVSQEARVSDLEFRHTGGTTGKSLQFWAGPDVTPFQWALWWRHRMRFGLRLGMRHVNFTGKLVVPPQQAKPPYWRECGPLHQLLLNMHHLVPAKAGAIIEELNRWSPDFYSGYPSVIHALALSAKEAGVRLLSRPKVVVTGAENLLENQRRDIAEMTGAVLTDQYGFSEACGNASQCPAGNYHEDFEFGVLECVDGTTDAHGRTHGRIVCTGFASPEAPFLRYEVGDAGVWEKPGVPCPCGRKSRYLVAIEGRLDDYVVTPEGRRIMRFDYLFKDTAAVRECQVVQRNTEGVTLRIVRRPEYQHKDEEALRASVGRWISPRLEVDFEYPTQIEREANGKFRAVKSFLNGTR